MELFKIILNIMTKEEKLITLLLEKYKHSKTNIVSVSKQDIQAINLTEQEIIQTIYLLQEDEYINIKEKSVHDDLSRYWNIALKSSCLHYFENKKSEKISKRNNWIQFWIPVALSAVAIIVSILALILEL